MLSSGKIHPLDYVTVYPKYMIDKNIPNFEDVLRRKNILKGVVFQQIMKIRKKKANAMGNLINLITESKRSTNDGD